MTIVELLVHLARFAKPEFDFEAAKGVYGPVVRAVGKTRFELRPSDPTVRRALLETAGGAGELAGVILEPHDPFVWPWSRLVEVLGEPTQQRADLDDWGGAVPWQFWILRAAPESWIIAKVARRDGDRAHVAALIARRVPPSLAR